MFKELDVDDWVSEINEGLKYREKYGNEKSWSELEAIFYNVHQTQLNAGPNILFSTGDALLSELGVPQPYLTVKARGPDFVNSSKLWEKVSNTLISDMEMPSEVDQALLHAYIYCNGILKIGFDSEYGWDPTHDQGGRKKPLGLTLTQHDPKTGRLIEFSDVQPGMPWVKAVLPHDFVCPWGTGPKIDSAPWLVHRVIRHIDDIKSDPKYENKKDLYPSLSMQDFVKSYQSVIKPYRMGSSEVRDGGGSSNRAEYCELWEIHDKRTGKVHVIATGHDKFLRSEVNLLQLEGLPFVGFSFTPKSRTFWTTSDAYYLKQHQAELSDITVQGTKLRRMMNLKFLYDENAIDEAELTKLTSMDAGVGVKIKGGHNNEESIRYITPPPNYELNNQAQQVRQNSKETVGFNANNYGEYQGGRKTAHEVEAVQEGQGVRMSRRQATVRDVYITTMKKIQPMAENFWHAPRITQIVGQDGTSLWQQFSGSHIRGEYEYACGFSNTNPETLDARRNNAMQAFAQLSQSPLVDPVQLAQFLANQYNDPEFSSIFKPGVLNGLASAKMLSPQQMQMLQSVGGDNAGQPQLGQGQPSGGMGPSGPQQT